MQLAALAGGSAFAGTSAPPRDSAPSPLIVAKSQDDRIPVPLGEGQPAILERAAKHRPVSGHTAGGNKK